MDIGKQALPFILRKSTTQCKVVCGDIGNPRDRHKVCDPTQCLFSLNTPGLSQTKKSLTKKVMQQTNAKKHYGGLARWLTWSKVPAAKLGDLGSKHRTHKVERENWLP